MHTQPMKESDGDFQDEKPASCACPKCGAMKVTYRVWESSCGGYEDEKYTCKACRHSWWVEGPDS